ncbi:MAG TPA: hypothetical protein VG713_05965, partial [Pirellulales bacterium]|nr:hypothetical protein [Pirellulales bacterium]
MNETIAVVAPRSLRPSSAMKVGILPEVRIARADRLWWETAVRWFIPLALVAAWPVALSRVINQGGTDYNYLCNCGRYLLEHGMREPTSALNRYWPSCDVPWMLLSLLPAVVGSTLWYALNSGSYLGLLRTIENRLLVGAAEPARRQATLIV